MATRRQVLRERRTGVSRGTLDVGAVLGGSLRAIAANAGAFVVLAASAYLPTIPVLIWTRSQGYVSTESQMLHLLAELAVPTLCQWTLAAFLVRGTYEHVRGRRISLDAMLFHGLSRLLPALGIALMNGLIVGGIVVACVVPGTLLSWMIGGVGTLLGFLVLAIAAVLAAMATAALWVAVPSVVVERCGFGALRRSFRLTNGVRWRVFAVLFVIGLCAFAIGKTVEVLTEDASTVVATTLEIVVQIVFGAWQAVAAVVGYYELRRAREGLDLDELAAVFE